MNQIDVLRAFYECRTDAAVAARLGRSKPSVSRWRKHGLPGVVLIQVLSDFAAKGKAPPPELLAGSAIRREAA